MAGIKYELRHLRAFMAAAEHLHFTKAAAVLGTSQPVLSRTIAELEEALSLALFCRTTRQVKLTEAGTAFYRETVATLRQLAQAELTARRTASGISGTVRIAYTDFAINGQLPEFLRLFREQNPDIRLDLSFAATTHQHKLLLDGRFDVGFMIGSLENSRFENFPFQIQSYVALVPSSHRLGAKHRVELAELADEAFVMGSAESWTAHRERVFSICYRAGFGPNIIQEASTSEGIFGLVAAGAGISIYSDCARNIQRRGLRVLDIDNLPEKIPISAVWEKQSSSLAVSQFCNFMKRLIERD